MTPLRFVRIVFLVIGFLVLSANTSAAQSKGGSKPTDRDTALRQAVTDIFGEMSSAAKKAGAGGAVKSLNLIVSNISKARNPCGNGIKLLEAILLDSRASQPTGTQFALVIADMFGTGLTAKINEENGIELSKPLRNNARVRSDFAKFLRRLRRQCGSAVWNTDYGFMYLPKSLKNDRSITADYVEDGGMAIGSYSASTRVFSGKWVERGSDEPCKIKFNGNPYWGQFKFTFSADHTSFDGVWGYCDGSLSRSWKGSLGTK